jgi:hypothetical protein
MLLPTARASPPVGHDSASVHAQRGGLESHPSPFPHPHELAAVSEFGTPDEYRAFQFFLEKTSDLISQYSQPYLWSVLLPQATWHQPSIKHSIIALASLHQSLTTVDFVAQQAKQRFILHYNNAIRALVADKPSVDMVLAACIIFWALENFNGGGQAAFDHMKAAIKILGEWKTKRRPNDPTDELISKYIEPAIVDGLKFASRNRVEELADQMSALSLTSRDHRIMNMHHPAFDSLDDAETYLCGCIERILALKSRTHTGSGMNRLRLADEIESLDAELFKWMHLFQDLTATGPVHIRRMLIVHNITANILLDQLKEQAEYNVSEGEPTRERDSDSPERLGRTPHNFIVMEVQDILDGDSATASDLEWRDRPRLGYIGPVFLVATSARAVDTRQRAINALRAMNLAEGAWSTSQAAVVAEAMLSIAAECAVPPTAVDLDHILFSFDEDDEHVHMTWTADETQPEDLRTSTVAIEMSSVDWHGLVSLRGHPATALHSTRFSIT